MRWDVSKALQAEGDEIPFCVEVVLPDAKSMGEHMAFVQPANLNGWMKSVGESIHVHGSLAFSAASRCFLCLKKTVQSFETPVNAEFSVTPDPQNPDVYPYDGVCINLTDMALDAAVLALPMQWRCGSSCRGLCPICGADLNDTSCSCRSDASEHPLSALQQLLGGDESEV